MRPGPLFPLFSYFPGGYEMWRARSASLDPQASTKIVGLEELFERLK